MADAPKIRVLGFFSKFKKVGDGMRQVDYVRFSPAQALNTQITEERVEKMRPPETDPDDDQPNRALKRLYMEEMWTSIGPAYEAWQKGLEIPAEGTPLAAWSGVTRDQADALRKAGVFTIEDLASLEDNKLQRIPLPNAREMRGLAKRFLDNGEDVNTAERLNDLEAKNTALQEQLEAAMQLLEEQAGASQRGPGRPKKQEAAEVTEAA